jgi:hypothetical protein
MSAGTQAILKLFLFSLSPSGQIPEQYLCKTTTASFRSFQIRHSPIVRPFGAIKCEVLTDRKVNYEKKSILWVYI